MRKFWKIVGLAAASGVAYAATEKWYRGHEQKKFENFRKKVLGCVKGREGDYLVIPEEAGKTVVNINYRIRDVTDDIVTIDRLPQTEPVASSERYTINSLWRMGTKFVERFSPKGEDISE